MRCRKSISDDNCWFLMFGRAVRSNGLAGLEQSVQYMLTRQTQSDTVNANCYAAYKLQNFVHISPICSLSPVSNLSYMFKGHPMKRGLWARNSSVHITLTGGSQSIYSDLKLQLYLKTEVSEKHFLPLYVPNPEFKVQQREW